MSTRESTFEAIPELAQLLSLLGLRVLVWPDLSLGIAVSAQKANLECCVQKRGRLTCKLQQRGMLPRVDVLHVDETSWS